MIPAHWIPYRREQDGELLGYLAESDGETVPMTVFGHPLAAAGDRDSAERVLDSVGLSYLAEKWLLRLPGRGEPIWVQIAEASPERLVVQSVDYGYEANYGTRFQLNVPEPGALSRT